VQEAAQSSVVTTPWSRTLFRRLIRSFWIESKRFAQSQAIEINKGEAFFADHGPEIVVVLGFYSLPQDYAARGVRGAF